MRLIQFYQCILNKLITKTDQETVTFLPTQTRNSSQVSGWDLVDYSSAA